MRTRSFMLAAMAAAALGAGCASTSTTTTSYTPGGQVSDRTVAEGDRVSSELKRVFELTVVSGEGIFEHANEGLARTGAMSLATADLAQKVQSVVKANTVIMNNQDIRSVVETNVQALVQGYTVDSAGYDPGTTKYRVKISILGERLVKEIERVRVR
jgi:hypothetical protein